MFFLIVPLVASVNMEIEELLEQADILGYISQFVALEPKNGEYWGLSPFQTEKTPSFSVDPNKKVWKDFSSGRGGNIIGFIKQYFHCGFPEALHRLMEWMNISPGEVREKPKIVGVMKSYGRKEPMVSPTERRIISESELSRYSKEPLTLWNQEGISQEICDEFEVRYDPFEETIVIPIRDGQGRLVNFSLRTTNPNYKLLGIPKYIYRYSMGALDFFYGWHKSLPKIQEKKEVIVVEGAKSVMKLYQYGYRNSVAALTSHICKAQFEILLKAGYDVVFSFDKDANPFNDKYIRQLRRFCKIYCVTDYKGLLGEKDAPVDQGKSVWEELYQNKVRMR